MAEDAAPPQSAGPTPEGPQTEQEYGAALERLNQLLDKLSDVRLALPSMVSQFSFLHETPNDLYTAFERSAYATVDALNQLKGQWNEQETQVLLKHARKSRALNTDFSVAGLNRHADPQIKTEEEDGMDES